MEKKSESDRQSLGLPSRIRACLFDLDGVLTETAKLHAAAWKKVFDEFLRSRSRSSGPPFVPFDLHRDYDDYVDGKLRLDGTRSFLASRDIHPDEETLRSLAERKDALFVEGLKKQKAEVYPGSIQYVRAVRDAGIHTAVVSSSRHCAQVLESARLTDLFEVRIDGNTVSEKHLSGKPAPDTYLAAARELGVNPEDAVVFEDALSGVEAGRAGHFGYVVGVDRAGQSSELRAHGANVVVTDLASLLKKAG